MNPKEISLGKSLLQAGSKTIQGDIVTISEEKYYKISNFNQMRPFFMNIVSDSDLWMFISSNGALTAGRRNPDNALFPYYTDDRIHDSHDITGSKTIIFVHKNDRLFYGNHLPQSFRGFTGLNGISIKTLSAIRLFLKKLM